MKGVVLVLRSSWLFAWVVQWSCREAVTPPKDRLRLSYQNWSLSCCRLCVIAGDISPVDVITPLPVLCEDNGIPYIYVPSKEVNTVERFTADGMILHTIGA